MKRWLIYFFVGITSVSFSQLSKDSLYKTLLGKDPIVDMVLLNPSKFRFQFILSEVSRNENGNNVSEKFDFSNDLYFYPASMVKLPTAIFTLEWLDSLGISLDSYVKMNKDFTCGYLNYIDITQKKRLQFDQIIEDMLSISDNNYYNILFNVLTPKRINNKLVEKNLLNTYIYRSFDGCYSPLHVCSHSFSIFNPLNEKCFYSSYSCLDSMNYLPGFKASPSKRIGSFVMYNYKRLKQPFDFNYHLDYPLVDIHNTMEKLFLNESIDSNKSFNLSSNSKLFLIRCLSKYPREMNNSIYHSYPDNYFKYILFGEDSISSTLGRYRTFSKIGISYGFVTESAYVVDFDTETDFLLTMSIYVNQNDVVNDGVYEYKTIARPFMARFSKLILGQLIEKKKRSSFDFDYFHFLKSLLDE